MCQRRRDARLGARITFLFVGAYGLLRLLRQGLDVHQLDRVRRHVEPDYRRSDHLVASKVSKVDNVAFYFGCADNAPFAALRVAADVEHVPKIRAEREAQRQTGWRRSVVEEPYALVEPTVDEAIPTD